MSNQDFSSARQLSSNIEMQISEVEKIVRKFFQSKDFDQKKILQEITNFLGAENIDESMLNFAVRQSTEKAKKLFEQEKIDQIALDGAIKLIVDWSFIKIKAKQENESDVETDEIQIGSNKPKGPSISSLL
ncbi:MAG TPA: hypothetical protein PLE96_00980 [bacterium]|nr:hypothetical protein [bacterium]